MKRDMVKRKSKNQTAGKSQREVDKEYRGNAMEMGGQAREGEWQTREGILERQ